MAENYARISSPDHGDVEFSNSEELGDFLKDQISHWQWVASKDPQLFNHLSQLITNVSSHIGSGRLQEMLDNTFLYYRFPIVGGDMANLIDNFLEEETTQLALTALSFITRASNPDLNSRVQLRALSFLIAYEQKLTLKSVEVSQASHKRAITSFQRQEAAARAKTTQYERKLETTEQRAERALSIARKYLSHKLAIQRARDDASLRTAIEEMEITKALYMEHMALKAPVEYWKRKAQTHTSQGTRIRSTLLKFAVIGGIGVVAALLCLAGGSIFAISVGVPTSVLVVLATVGVVITTIVFWAGRILTRLYLSEVHLGIDASERATMVETYLALTSVGEATKEERAIILASLFRPTADGIVKDDSAPDLSPAGILSRLGAS